MNLVELKFYSQSGKRGRFFLRIFLFLLVIDSTTVKVKGCNKNGSSYWFLNVFEQQESGLFFFVLGTEEANQNYRKPPV